MYSRSTYNGTFRIPEQYNGVAFREVKEEKSSSKTGRDAVGRISAIPQSPVLNTSQLPIKKSYTNNIQFQKKRPETEKYEDIIEEEVSQPLITDTEEKEEDEREKTSQSSFSQTNKIKEFFGGDEIIIAALILTLLGNSKENEDSTTLLILILLLLL